MGNSSNLASLLITMWFAYLYSSLIVSFFMESFTLYKLKNSKSLYARLFPPFNWELQGIFSKTKEYGGRHVIVSKITFNVRRLPPPPPPPKKKDLCNSWIICDLCIPKISSSLLTQFHSWNNIKIFIKIHVSENITDNLIGDSVAIDQHMYPQTSTLYSKYTTENIIYVSKLTRLCIYYNISLHDTLFIWFFIFFSSLRSTSNL